MKKLLLILFLLPLITQAQNKKDNTFILSPVSYAAIKSVLFQNGYTLINDDTILITTTSKEMSRIPVALRFMINRTGDQTILKAQWKVTTDPGDFAELHYGGIKGNWSMKGWWETDRIAKLLSPDVTYAKQ
ncbi:MAG: hypothetical protein ABI834_09325 [Ginsengibacter sp.]